MPARRLFATILPVSTLVLLAGCSAVQQAVVGAASGPAQAAADQVTRQICAPLADGVISAQDQRVLSALLAGAQAAGVGAEVLTPLEQVARSGDQVPAAAVTALREACGIAPAPSPS